MSPPRDKLPVLSYRKRRGGHPIVRAIVGGAIGLLLGFFLSVIPLILLHQVSAIDKSIRLGMAIGSALSGAVLLGLWSASEDG